MPLKLPSIQQSTLLRIFGLTCLSVSTGLWYLCYRAFRKPDESEKIPWVSDDLHTKANEDIFAEGYKAIRMKVPLRAVGTIIGKQGSMLRKIQCSSRTVIHFDEKGSNSLDSRMNDQKAAGSTNSSLPEFSELVIRGYGNRVHVAEKEIQAIIDSVPVVEEEEITIDAKFVGRLIGRGGDNIRRLKTAYNCSINVAKDTGSNVTTRQVQIQGTRSQIEETKNDILQMIQTITSRENTKVQSSPDSGVKNLRTERIIC